ncbi:MAG: hypothetical protein DHS20C01_12170 [marine bacterium B5-7]|nr:MAG: hypothetical protein DHS20C01_12170 [marine bacterium B5-7]
MKGSPNPLINTLVHDILLSESTVHTPVNQELLTGKVAHIQNFLEQDSADHSHDIIVRLIAQALSRTSNSEGHEELLDFIQSLLPILPVDSNATQEKIRALIDIYRDRHGWDQVVIHLRQLTLLPIDIAVEAVCGLRRNKLVCPDDLTIVLIHNYDQESLMEASLKYTGIENFVVLHAPLDADKWRNSIKLSLLHDAIADGRITTQYLLYVDSCDAVIRNDPQMAIDMLNSQKCELLMSVANNRMAYSFMPLQEIKTDRLHQQEGIKNRCPNSGTYIAKTDYMLELLAAAIQFTDDNDLTLREYRWLCNHYKKIMQLSDTNNSLNIPGWYRQENPKSFISGFPNHIGCDQAIFRYLYPDQYPTFKLDFSEKLALRFWKTRKDRIRAMREEQID